MAILFQCPHCGARLRVPDSAAGKQGTCPSCRRRLLVPRPESSVAEPESPRGSDHRHSDRHINPDGETFEPPTPSLTDGPPLPPVPSPSDAAPPETDAWVVESAENPVPVDAMVAVPGTSPADAPTAAESVAARLKRPRRNRAALIIPLAMGGVMLAVGIWLVVKEQPKLEGTLTAVRLNEEALPPALVPRDDLPLDDMQRTVLLEQFATEPQTLYSELMEVEFRGTSAGLEVVIHRSRKTRFVRVDVAADAVLTRYRTQQARELDADRLREYKRAVEAFCHDWQQAAEADTAMDTLPEYRDRLGLNALRGGLGYHVVAQVGSTLYPCVYEDERGLYFLLPETVQRFELIGRELPDGRRPFEGHYSVVVRKP